MGHVSTGGSGLGDFQNLTGRVGQLKKAHGSDRVS